MRWPRIHIDFSFTVGDDQQDDRYVDAIGHNEQAGTHVGFATPGTIGAGYEEDDNVR